MFKRIKQILRWGWRGIEVWNLLLSLGVPAMIKAIFQNLFDGWSWYNQLLLFGGIVLTVLGILIVCFRDKIADNRHGKISRQTDILQDALNKANRNIDELTQELQPYKTLLAAQRGHEEQWLRPVIEWVDFERQGLSTRKIILKYQIASGLLYDFKPYRMWVKLRIGTYEPKEGWEIVPTRNLLKCKHSQWASEEFTVNDDDLLKIIEGCRKGLLIAQTLKVFVQLREGEDLKQLEGSYSINPYSEFSK